MISHEHECVFVHVPKCAGQSIEHVFLDLVDLTWEARAPLLLRPNDRPELGPPRLAHLKACEYVKYHYLSQKLFDQYFKFAFVRNPWDRTVSLYKYSAVVHSGDFRTFVLRELATVLWQPHYWFVGPQREFLYSEDGELLVDFVGKFETLQADFDKVCESLGLPAIKLKHVNKGGAPSRPDLGAYQNYYDDETRQCVGELYIEDIQIFGYQFD